MVVNIGRVLSEKWEYVAHEIRAVNEAVVERGAILKVIFENDCASPPPPFFFTLYTISSLPRPNNSIGSGLRVQKKELIHNYFHRP
jgi:hypothetical protein